MKSLNLLLAVDEKGRVALPISALSLLKIRAGDELEIYIDVRKNDILLRKHDPRRKCVICGRPIPEHECAFIQIDGSYNIDEINDEFDRLICQSCAKHTN